MPSRRRTATVLFLDIVGSTHVASELGDARFRQLISRFNRIVHAGLRRHGGHEEDRAGDGFFATFPEPAQGIRCACQLAEDVRELGIEIRAAVHTGETERIDGKTQGIAVIIGARVMSLGGPGEVLVTSTSKELATGSGFSFEDFSGHELKGVPGTWQVWAVTGVEGTPRPGPLPAVGAAERLGEIGGRGPRRNVPRRAVIAGLASAAIVAGGLALLMPGDDAEPQAEGSPAPGTLLQVDPATGRTVAEIPVRPIESRRNLRHTAHPLVVGQGGVWLIRDASLIHLDPLDADVRGRPALGGGNPLSINVASGFDSIWVMTHTELLRIHPATDEVRVFATIRNLASVAATATATTDIAVGAGYVWMGTAGGQLVRVDPRTGDIRRAEELAPIDSVVAGSQDVWTSDVIAGTVTRYDPDTMRPVETIEVSGGVDALVIGEAGVWVLSRSAGQVTAVIDGEARSPIRVGDAPTSIAAGLGGIWVGDGDGMIWQIDQDTKQVKKVSIGSPIRAIAVDEEEDTLWVDVR